MYRTGTVLFLLPYPLRKAPSQRFRVELFLPFLQAHNIQYELAPFFDRNTYSILYGNHSKLKKLLGVIKGYLSRLLFVLFKVHQYEYVFIHREAAPLGPPVFEWLISKVFGKKIIYDYDDAIWIPDSKNKLLNWFKAHWKVKWICRWAYKVVGGNEYLCSYARMHNSNVVYIPTCVDVESRHNRLKDQEELPLTIGWTGSHSTLKYLDPIVPVLKNLRENFDIRMLVICNQEPGFNFQGLEFIKWNESSEIEDLLQVHVGIMPLIEDSWSEGKCGFKLIQYLALGIPAVASPVGVNKNIIDEGANGFLCKSHEDWQKALEVLINNAEIRKQMGAAGRKKIIADYSIQVYETSFVNLFT